MIVSAQRRLLAHLRTGSADHAARELANHLNALHYISRLRARSVRLAAGPG
jgi:hypothetical protein